MKPHTPTPTPLDLAAVDAAIASTVFAGQLHHLATTPSTNNLAIAAARSGAPHGVWIADQQTAGRGRAGHKWHSAPGTTQYPDGLYMSALVTPVIPVQSAISLSLTTAIAVQSAIASVTGLRIRDQIDIRWPNDLMLHGRHGTACKCGGILIETSAHSGAAPFMLRYAVIGIGLNVNHTTFPRDLEPIATSPPPRHARPIPAAAARAARLRHPPRPRPEARRLESTSTQPITQNLDVEKFSSWITGKHVRVEARDGDPGYTGITAGLDPRGFLLVTGDDGKRHIVLSAASANSTPHAAPNASQPATRN